MSRNFSSISPFRAQAELLCGRGGDLRDPRDDPEKLSVRKNWNGKAVEKCLGTVLADWHAPDAGSGCVELLFQLPRSRPTVTIYMNMLNKEMRMISISTIKHLQFCGSKRLEKC
ncbi:hypothetical protein ACCT30_42810, partial [Rhizobium ruizarguesonis]